MWFVVTVIINKTVVAGNTTDTLLLTAVACVTVVCPETLAGSYIPTRQSCLSVATSVPLMQRPESGCGRA